MTKELEPGRIYKLKGIRQWVKIIRTLTRPETGELYAEVWDSDHAGYWSGQRLIPTIDIMANRVRAER